MIDSWLARRPTSARATLRVGAVELARLLGHLVFASQVVPGGRTYMQGMLGQFKGLEIDWRRGLVRPAPGANWTEVEVSSAFWRDIEWWDDCFERRNCTSLVQQPLGEAAITGTDASGWGTGQVAWIDGGKDEVRLRFGAAENRRPINWRELLGMLRLIEIYGPQLQGMCVLVETDNMSAYGAASKMHSTAPDMQELLRRLLAAASAYDIALRFTHTPGVMLHRPDQTSRGDPVEEPRVRMRLPAVETCSARFGPFTEWVGAERQLPLHKPPPGCPPRLWIHPTFSTVASALRLIGERLLAADGERATGVVVVPDEPGAKWASLLRHFTVVGRRPAGDGHLEMCQLGTWRHVHSLRPSLVLSFPRTAGSGAVLRVAYTSLAPRPGYVTTANELGVHLPLCKGSLVYRPAPVAGTPGVLYIVWEDFNPTAASHLLAGQPDVALAELCCITSGRGKAASRTGVFALDNRRVDGEHGRRPASFSGYARGLAPSPWYEGAEVLWAVDGLVREVAPTWKLPPTRQNEGQAAQWGRKAFSFDFREAERLIAFASAGHARDQAPAGNIGVPETLTGVVPVDELAAAVQQMDVGQEPAAMLAEARAAADQAAAARQHAAAPAARGKAPAAAPQQQRRRTHFCRYPGMVCEGCGECFAIDEVMEPSSGAMVHPGGSCAQLARTKLLMAAKEAREARMGAGRQPPELASAKRQAQLAHRFSDARMGLACKCLDGKCTEAAEARVFCQGARDELGVRVPCGRGLHAVACGQVASAHARTCMFVCLYCRAAEMTSYALGATDTLLRYACRGMLVELAAGPVSTAKNVADYERLEREFLASFMNSDGVGAAHVIEPRRSEESFIAFISWLVTDAGRARSFGQIMRMSGIAMARMELPVMTSVPRIKHIIKETADQVGTDPEPCTIPTALVVQTMLTQVLPPLCSTEYILKRSLVLFDGETLGGARLGEMTGGGDGHGVLANMTDIAWPVGSDPASSTVNLHIEDSKTGFSRDMTYMGVTRGALAIEGARHLRELWEISGFAIRELTEDGMTMLRPDYWVLRLSLLGMPRTGSPHSLQRLITLVTNTAERVVVRNRSWVLVYLRERYTAGTSGEEEKYVNVAGGAYGCEEIAAMTSWLDGYGYGNFIASGVVPGPLLRATVRGSPNKLTHMPLKPGSTYAHVPKALLQAYEMNKKNGVIDPEEDLAGAAKPHYGNHGNRRHSDKVARDTLALTGVSEGDIDDFYGWDQRQRKKKSQLHYHGRVDRLHRAKVTMML